MIELQSVVQEAKLSPAWVATLFAHILRRNDRSFSIKVVQKIEWSDALILWLADAVKFEPCLLDDPGRCFVVLADVGLQRQKITESVIAAIEKKSCSLPLQQLVFCDDRYLTYTGRDGFVDLLTMTELTELRRPACKVTSYNLSELLAGKFAKYARLATMPVG